jgi:hypothetical protein
MASTYVNDLRLNEMATGDGSGTWGTTTNTNLELIAEAFSYGTEVITTNADTHTTTIADGATDPGRALYLKYTGTLDSACTITIGPNTVSKVWIIENGTSGSQNIIISQGSGANITIPAGDTKVVYSDGAGAGAAFVDAFASLSVVDLKVQDDLTVTGDIDVDGTTNLDVVDIDGAVDMASTALVTGVLTTTAATVFNGGFASNAASTISTADNSAQITLISTDADASVGPLLDLYRNSASPADNDIVGQIRMQGKNSAGETIDYVTLFSQIQDVTDGTEDGRFFISAMTGGTDYSRMDLLSNESVFNQDGQDLDFRVESDNDANALFVQGSDGFVGIGTASPSRKLHISSSGTDCAIRLDNTVSERPFLLAYDDSQNLTFTNSSDSGYIAFVNGTGAGTERVRIDSSGNLLVGGTTTTTIPTLNKGIYLVSSTDGDVIGYSLYANEGTNNRRASFFLNDSNGVYGFDTTASSGVCDFVVQSAGAERMRIASGGEVSINTTSIGGTLNVLATGSDTSNWCQRYFTTGTASELYVVDFIDYQGQRVGYITNNPVGNTTAYVTSSDYRLKENVDYTWDATTRLKQLKPARFNWIRDESNTLVDGFLAHEVEDIVPEAISGEKDATETKTNAVVNSYGNYIADNVTEEEWLAGKEDGTYDADTTWAASHTQNFYQGIDQAKLVPLLVKTIQELEARITTLENA